MRRSRSSRKTVHQRSRGIWRTKATTPRELDRRIKPDMWQVEQAAFIIYWAAWMLQQGTNEAEKHKSALFITRKQAQPEGADTAQQGTRTLLYTNNTLLLLSGANPITSLATISMFSPEWGAFAALYERCTRRTPKSRCIIYKRAQLRLFWRISWHLGLPPDHNRDRNAPPGIHQFKPSPFVLNNASTFP